MNNTFFNFKLDLEPNLIDMIYDVLRMSTIQLVTQIMFYMNNSSLSLFSETFIKTFVFINFGIIVYYLLIRKLFSFVSDDYLRVTDNNYVSTPPMNTATPKNLPKAPAMLPPPPTPVTPVVSNNTAKNSTNINSLLNNNSNNTAKISTNNTTNTPNDLTNTPI